MREPVINDAGSLSALAALQAMQCSAHSHVFKNWQQDELRTFIQQGFPNRKNEHWKYTNISAIAKTAFTIPQVTPTTIDVDSLKIADAYSIVFVNGYYEPALSTIEKLPKNIIITDVKTIVSQRDLYQEWHIPTLYQTAFTSLNSALFTDGLFVSIPSHVQMDRPIQLIYINTTTGQASMHHPRHVIKIGDNSQVTIFEEYYGHTDDVYFNNVVTQIYVGQGAHVHHYKLQHETPQAFHIANTMIQQGKNSHVFTYQVALGGRLSRDDLNYQLISEGANCHLLGLYCLESQNHMDHHSRIDHHASHCVSRQHYKGIIHGKSKAVFNGKIVVSPNVAQTTAHQSNQNLLLSPSAEINTKPELEIYSNDVQCTHGATVGQLDEEALFYLQSRGIEYNHAYQLLIFAFAEEILNQIPCRSIAKKIQHVVLERLSTQSYQGG